jgi:hypothetical protein
MFHEFMECDTCRAKPGSPTLCKGCLHNRELINRLIRENRTLHQHGQRMTSMLAAERSLSASQIKRPCRSLTLCVPEKEF